jgi:alpha-D-ribose 1-methylphosphonate 5-triphosphate synthase subunit PhnH
MDSIELCNQKNYRGLIRAMSHPGLAVQLEAPKTAPVSAVALAIGRCLLDQEVSFCVIGSGETESIQASLIDATHVRLESVDQADFVFILGGASYGEVRRVKRGNPESPEDGATLVYATDPSQTIASIDPVIKLTGPGIAEQDGMEPQLSGITPEEYYVLQDVNADYPLGVDVFLVHAGGQLMAIPRSTRITME